MANIIYLLGAGASSQNKPKYPIPMPLAGNFEKIISSIYSSEFYFEHFKMK